MARRSNAAVARDFATRSVPTVAPADTAGQIRSALEGASFDSAADVAVVADGRLSGTIPVERVLSAPSDRIAADLVEGPIASVGPETPSEIVASMQAEHDGGALAVEDDGGRFLGLVPARRMLHVLLTEHEEDLARIGGFRTGAGRARRAAEETVGMRLRHRLPWLLCGLAGAMASAILLGSFEEQLNRVVVLAFFVPAVVYMADAVGTQTEAILIRGLAVGVRIRDVIGREFVTGAITGALVGAAFFPFILIGWDDADVALAVALALFASCSIATAVAMLLPWLFQRMGTDPAFGSGPLATVIQDLLSIAVYLGIAIPLAA